MCGRFTLRTPLTVLIEHYDIDARGDRQLPLFEARYNIAPTQDVLAIRADAASGARTASMLRWGLIPSGSTADKVGSGPPMINARSETLSEKPTFRNALKRRRCIIPADGFYEWQQTGSGRGKKEAFHIHRPDGAPVAFAGLWEKWVQRPSAPSAGPSPQVRGTSADETGALTIESCTIVTTAANASLRELHDRMPVILAPGDYSLWLDPKVEDSAKLQHLYESCGNDELVFEPVGTHVNKVANDDPKCIAVQRSLF
jgi:putative SOS response-associated peptidase YedK